MRLTEKDINSYEYNDDIRSLYGTGVAPIYDKLRQLEDIEDELGIDLITLVKALKNGIYHKTRGGIWYVTYLDLQFSDCFALVNYDQEYIFELKDYGKTWALTKEELE